MAREKMFDPAFQKSFTESINKENKIRNTNYLEDIGGIPRRARVDFGEDIDSDDSDYEEAPNQDFQKILEDFCENYRSELEDEQHQIRNSSSKIVVFDKKPSEKKDKSLQRKEKTEKKNFRYVFPICNFCDFGWKYSSRHYITCPYHGPFRRGRLGYNQCLREYLIDQIRCEALKIGNETEEERKLVNTFYL